MRDLYKTKFDEYVEYKEGRNSLCFTKHSYANFDELKHSMLIGGGLEKIYNDLSDLERADLIDFFNLERHGRTNKKRRNILR